MSFLFLAYLSNFLTLSNFCNCADQFRGFELDALRSSIAALTARLRKQTQSPKGNESKQQSLISGRKKILQDSQISLLKSSLEKLSLINSENSKKVNLVETALKDKESSR